MTKTTGAPDWHKALEAHEAAAEEGAASELAATPWIKFPELGACITGRVVDFFTTRDGDKIKTNVKLADKDGEIRPMGLGGNLSSIISTAMGGHVLHIVWIDEQDVGKASPMKVFRVFDYGDAWPSGAEPFPV